MIFTDMWFYGLIAASRGICGPDSWYLDGGACFAAKFKKDIRQGDNRKTPAQVIHKIT